MSAGRLIASRLEFKAKMAVASIAISFFVIIIAVAVTQGFRSGIRTQIRDFTGDIVLRPQWTSSTAGADQNILKEPCYLPDILALEEVEGAQATILRAGIVKGGESIYGALFKAVCGEQELSAGGAAIGRSLARREKLEEGDKFNCYFVSEGSGGVKVRRFTVESIYDDSLAGVSLGEGQSLIMLNEADLRRINRWDESLASGLEITLKDKYSDRQQSIKAARKIGEIILLSRCSEQEMASSIASCEDYSQIYDWLDLISYNVYAILFLMIAVAGFNMISGVLIMLFRNISTIGLLKALGMKDRNVAGVFLRISARAVVRGLVIGNLAAFALCCIQKWTHIIKLNPANYYLSYVPIDLNIKGILAADACAFILILLLTLIPCLFISKVDPAQSVKAE